jgi:hypothetical protein
MRSLGGLLFFLGAGSVVLNLFQYEFMLLAPLTPYQPAAGIVVAIIGAVLIGLAEWQERNARAAAQDLPPVASPAPGAGPTDTGDRSLSSPVPAGPASEPPAASGTGTATPPPVVPSAGIATSEPAQPAAPPWSQPAVGEPEAQDRS